MVNPPGIDSEVVVSPTAVLAKKVPGAAFVGFPLVKTSASVILIRNQLLFVEFQKQARSADVGSWKKTAR